MKFKVGDKVIVSYINTGTWVIDFYGESECIVKQFNWYEMVYTIELEEFGRLATPLEKELE